MDQKTKMYLIVGGATLVVILLVVAAIVYFRGGDPTATLGAATAATVAAGAAAVNRQKTRDVIADAKETLGESIDEAVANRDEAKSKMDAVVGEVAGKSRDQKEKDGENLFN